MFVQPTDTGSEPWLWHFRSAREIVSQLTVNDVLVQLLIWKFVRVGGGIIAAYAFLAKDAPKYLPGYGICVSFTCLAIISAFIYYVGVTRANSTRKNEDTGSEVRQILYVS